jgi:hypothetical protein
MREEANPYGCVAISRKAEPFVRAQAWQLSTPEALRYGRA